MRRKRKADGTPKVVSPPCGVDRLSSLPDDVLGHILSFLPTPQAVLLCRLSRRWRRVWPSRATALNLSVRDCVRRGAGPRFCSVARGALARFPTPGIPAVSVEVNSHAYLAGANAWYREAMDRAVGSVRISAPRGLTRFELPRCTRATALALRLSHLVDLELPDPTNQAAAAAPAFGRLAELSLTTVLLPDGAPPLHEFLSSCCPRLRRLRLSCVRGGDAVRRLALSSDALELLDLNNVDGLQWLDVAAANLRSLSVRSCFRRAGDDDDDVEQETTTEVVISAPRMEAVRWRRSYPSQLRFLAGAAHVRRLTGLKLPARGRSDRFDFPCTVQLLRACSAVEHLGLDLVMPDQMALLNWLGPDQGSCEEEDLLRHVPQLPNVRVLSLTIRWGIGGNIVPSLASLLSRFPRLTGLCIDSSPYCLTVLEGQGAVRRLRWQYQFGGARADGEKLLQLDSLREISIDGLKGTDREECRVMELLLADALPSLQRVSLKFHATAMPVNDEIADEIRERFPMSTGSWTRPTSSVLAWSSK
ncbi:hypothetical protein ACP4OV_024476 [Aristida adscensionis]